MADPSAEVPLPFSVEEMLAAICRRHSQPPPEAKARRQLALLGEEASLQLLRKISSSSEIRTLTGFIIYMARQAETTVSEESLSFSLPSSSGCSGSVSTSGDAMSHSPSLKQQSRHTTLQPLSFGVESTSTSSPHQMALGELEFRKAFLILSYTGKKRLEDVTDLETIRKFKNLRMSNFEPEVWKDIGCHCIKDADRRKNLDFDSGGTFLYHCLVDPDGSYSFKGPYLDKTKTHLQRVLGDDNVLVVKFAEEAADRNKLVIGSNSSNAWYYNILKEGILVGLRRYRFFVFKDGGKEEKKKNPTSSPVKCYFVCMESNALVDEKKPYILSNKSIHEARCVFMHVHTVSSLAKYMARLSLILSKTIKLEVDLESVDIQRIGDEPCRDEDGRIVYNKPGEPQIHTDGTGFISEDLALKCPTNISKVKYLNHADIKRTSDRIALEENSLGLTLLKSHIGEPPLLIQFRLFNNGYAVKGTFLVNKKLPPKTIQIRRSMIKVKPDLELANAQTANSLEIVGTSSRPKKTYLSRYLIALLNYGGVPREYFMDLLMNALDDAQNIYSNKHAALRVALRYGDMDDYLVSRMILCGIPLQEPYLHSHLSLLMRENRKGLKEGKLPVSECYYLMGTADPTGMLGRDKVCVILDSGQISGKVLVYKHPGLHFGDIHVLTATYVKDLEDIVGNAKYAIFFPTKGPRSLADEIANSDFDGDMYWVSRNPELLDYFKASEPWKRPDSAKSLCDRKPTDFSAEELENALFDCFLTTRFQPSNTIGMAADSWLAFMDRLLILGDECAREKETLKKKMLQLVNIYYDALDASKTGIKVEVPKHLKTDKYPHFMDRKNSYDSTSILGLIYDKVHSFQTEDCSVEEVTKLPCFDVEIPQVSLERWRQHYQQYLADMTNALKLDGELKNNAADEVIQKYKQILYGDVEFELSARKREEIFDDALAIYHITYDYAKITDGGKCKFAWKVAGRALCKLYSMKQDEESIICVPSVLREVLN